MIKIPTVTLSFSTEQSKRDIMGLSDTAVKSGNAWKHPFLLAVFITLNFSTWMQNKVIIFTLQCICAHCFYTRVSFRHAALCYPLPANKNTSKMLGVSIPRCACVTKHKTNTCCREKLNMEVYFKGLLVIFTLGDCQQEVNTANLSFCSAHFSFFFLVEHYFFRIIHVVFE